MAARSQRITFRDVRRMSDAVHECRELWVDPSAWQRHLLGRATAYLLGADFNRVQFTPDTSPTELVGENVMRAGETKFVQGTIFTNVLLADEINRTPPRTQAALLEAMAERSVTIEGRIHRLPDPFLVIATQNPFEQEGVFPLPESNLDRFLFKIIVDYPGLEEEREIVYRMGAEPPVAQQVIGPEELVRLQGVASHVFVHHALVDYVVRLVVATRTPAEHGLGDVAGWVAYGASPRATLGIVSAARALA